MGESRTFNTPLIGDVILVDLDDGVFTGQGSHYSHKQNGTNGTKA